MAIEASRPGQLTELLDAWSAGSEEALKRLFELVYGDLHRIAEWRFAGERPGHTLQPTAIVHEAYLRLVGHHQKSWRNRLQFYAFVGKLMRQVLADHALKSGRQKRGGDRARVPLTDVLNLKARKDVDVETLIALGEALARLETIDPRQCEVVELRFFSGLTVAEVAEVQETSKATVKRDWDMAKHWLARELKRMEG